MKQISTGGKRLMKIFLFISFIVGLSACKKEQNNTEDLGRTILFVSNRDGNDEIYAMNSDSTNLIRLTNNAVPDGRATWSADGQLLHMHLEMRAQEIFILWMPMVRMSAILPTRLLQMKNGLTGHQRETE
jgi:hypothetical protein